MNRKASTLIDAFAGLPRGSLIVEIGCVRFSREIPSDGYSTVHLAQAAGDRGWRMESIDIDPQAVRNARALLHHRRLDDVCRVTNADGAEWLRTHNRKPIHGLYLDGAADPAQAVEQYEAANLAPDAVIVIDDIQPIKLAPGNALDRGKGDLLLDRLEADGWTVTVHDTEKGYRMAVARPSKCPDCDCGLC